MKWVVVLHSNFEPEFFKLSEAVQDQLLAHARLLEEFGPQLARPHVDTLKDSAHSNLKELRFDADNGAWRVAFAFDPKRKAILLAAGDKSGCSQRRFYKQLIAKADLRLSNHLAGIAVRKHFKR